jgi:LacI family fructose operon transcriptional repressor
MFLSPTAHSHRVAAHFLGYRAPVIELNPFSGGRQAVGAAREKAMSRGARERKTTIYDIARAAGASPATVSMVLNGSWTSYRISKETADRILECSRALGYKVNLKARALRLSRSGLAGMIIPHYRNRFFAGLAENFETEARRRGLCPVVVSMQRDEEIARNVTETLLAQQVEFLFTAGVGDPDALNALCRQADIPSVNIDLPGRDAPSVVSDNRGGARALTLALVDRIVSRDGSLGDLLFLGGIRGEFATEGRLAGFEAALRERGIRCDPELIDCCGYLPAAARQSLTKSLSSRGRMPDGLFINSITAFEGFTQFVGDFPREVSSSFSVGCFDWDPFAAHLPFDVMMMRQDVESIIANAFALVDAPASAPYDMIVVPPAFAGRRDAAMLEHV